MDPSMPYIFVFQILFQLGVDTSMSLYICVPMTFLTLSRGRVHAIVCLCSNYFFSLALTRPCHCWHERVHAKLKSHWNTNVEWHGRVHAKFKKSLEHKYTMVWASMPILKRQCHPLRIRSAHRLTWKSSPNFFKCIEFQYGVCPRRHADSCTGVQGKMLVEKRCFRAEKSTEIYGRKSTEGSI